MTNNDWGTTADEWQQGKRQEPTFKQDLGGFAFHLSMAALIGLSVAGVWQIANPQLVIRVTAETPHHR